MDGERSLWATEILRHPSQIIGDIRRGCSVAAARTKLERIQADIATREAAALAPKHMRHIIQLLPISREIISSFTTATELQSSRCTQMNNCSTSCDFSQLASSVNSIISNSQCISMVTECQAVVDHCCARVSNISATIRELLDRRITNNCSFFLVKLFASLYRTFRRLLYSVINYNPIREARTIECCEIPAALARHISIESKIQNAGNVDNSSEMSTNGCSNDAIRCYNFLMQFQRLLVRDPMAVFWYDIIAQEIYSLKCLVGAWIAALDDVTIFDSSIALAVKSFMLPQGCSFSQLLLEVSSFVDFFAQELHSNLRWLLKILDMGNFPYFRNSTNLHTDMMQQNSKLFCRLEASRLASHVCVALVTLQQISIVEDLFGEIFVLPGVEQAASEAGKLSSKPFSSSANEYSNQFEKFLDIITQKLLADDCIPVYLINLFRCVPNVSFRLIAGVIASNIFQGIERYFSSIFIPVSLDIFVTNHRLTQKLIFKIEKLMSKHEILIWRKSAFLVNFNRKFKTNICFSLMKKEQIYRIRSSFLELQDLRKKFLYDNKVFWLKPSVQVIKECNILFRDDIFIPVNLILSIEFLTEILLHYIAYLESFLSFMKGNSNSYSSEIKCWPRDITYKHIGFVIIDVQNIIKYISSDETSVSSRCSLEENFLSQCLIKLEKAKIEFEDNCVQCEPNFDDYIIQYAKYEESNSEKEFMKQKKKMKMYDEMRCLTVSQFQLIRKRFLTIQQEMENYLLDQLKIDSAGNLCSINSIPHLYRMTKKLKPRIASPYVDAILSPLISFNELLSADVDDVMMKYWLTKVINYLASIFHVAIENLLSVVVMRDNSLRRMKNFKSEATELLSVDYNQTLLQVDVDVKYFLSQCKINFPIIPEDLEEIIALKKYVTYITN